MLNPLSWVRSRLFADRRKGVTLSEFMRPLRLTVGAGAEANVTQPFCQSPWVYAGARGKSRNIAGIPFTIKAGRHDAQEGQPLPSTDPVARLFSRPSPFLSMSAMMEAISVMLDVDGEVFLTCIGPDGKYSPKGKIPAEFMLCRGAAVLLDPGDIDPRTKMVRFWTMGREKVPAESVIQFALFNPNNPYRGMSPLTAAMQGIQTEYKASAYAQSMLDNDCTPGVVLKMEGYLGKDGIDAVKKDFKDAHRGARRAREPLVLSSGMEIENVSFSPSDMQMPQEREWSREVVKAVLGVTDHEMGTAGDLNRASSIAAKRWLWDNTLIPLCRFIEETFWYGLFRSLSAGARDVWGEFDLSKVDALSSDMSDKCDQATKLVDLGYTLNQANDRIGLGMDLQKEDSADGAGAVQDTALNGAQISSLLEVTTQVSAGALPPDAAVALLLVSFPTIDEAEARRIVYGAARAPAPQSPTAPPASGGDVAVGNQGGDVTVKGLSQAGRARIMRRWHDSATAFLGGQLRKYFRTIQRDVVKLPGRKSLPDLTPDQVNDILGAPEEWRRIAESMLSGPVNRVTMSALRNARVLIGGFEVVDPSDPRWMLNAARRTAQLVRVAMRWRTRIRDSILQSVTAGDQSVTTLGQLLEREFGGVIQSSGLTIARTETAMIGNQVRNDVFRDEGIDEKEWSAANDAHTRASHSAVDGERVGIDSRFSNGLMYPSDPAGPPEEVINCRCVAVPRVKP